MTADIYSAHFKRLISTSQDFYDITQEIKKLLADNNFITETTTYITFTNNKKHMKNLKQKLASALSDKIAESKYGKPQVDDYSLYFKLINLYDLQRFCNENG